MDQQQPLPTTPLPQRDGSVRRLLIDSVPGGLGCPGCVQRFSTDELLAGHRQIAHSSHNNGPLKYGYQQFAHSFYNDRPSNDKYQQIMPSSHNHRPSNDGYQQAPIRSTSPAGLSSSPDECEWEGCKGRFFTDRMRSAHFQTHAEAPQVPTHQGHTLHALSASDAKRDP